MITNNQQYKRIKNEITQLKEVISEMKKVVLEDTNVAVGLRLQLNSSYRHLEKMEKQMKDYQELISNDLTMLEFDSQKNAMDDAIMSFRIASKLTQTKIAEMLYLKPQQVQRYEQDNYRTASFERILQLLEALDVQLILKKDFKKPFDFIGQNSGWADHYRQEVIKEKQLLNIGE